MEALSSLDPPPNAEVIGGNKRRHNDIDNEFRHIDQGQSRLNEWVREGGKDIGVVKGYHDARRHVVITSFSPPDMPNRFPTVNAPYLLWVRDLRNDVLNHTRDDSHEQLFFDVL